MPSYIFFARKKTNNHFDQQSKEIDKMLVNVKQRRSIKDLF